MIPPESQPQIVQQIDRKVVIPKDFIWYINTPQLLNFLVKDVVKIHGKIEIYKQGSLTLRAADKSRVGRYTFQSSSGHGLIKRAYLTLGS